MHRLFVAIELSDDVRDALQRCANRLSRRLDGVRWVRRDLMHLTVQFLGDVDDTLVPEVCEAVRQAAADTSPMVLGVAGTGCFPPRGAVRVVWAGGDEPTGALAGCAARVGENLEAVGFERERRAFSPHITLGRVRHDDSRGSLRQAVEEATLDPATMTVQGLSVMASVLSPSGPEYTVMAHCPLAASLA